MSIDPDNCCISCKFYNLGYAECRRFPPESVVFKDKRYNVYDQLEEFDNQLWMYPSLSPDNGICGEFVRNPYFEKDDVLVPKDSLL